jgi:multidrug resistance efflux pump
MVIVAVLYIALVWLLFVKLKWLRWGWLSGTVTVIGGLLVMAAFDGFLNYLAPAGRVSVLTSVIEVTPNVAGPVAEISVQPNQPVKEGAVLFRIDPTPFDAKVRALDAQFKLAKQRLAEITQLQERGAGRQNEVEQRQAETDQLHAEIDAAKYDLEQTTVRAPADGYATVLSLRKGDRVGPTKSVISFVVSDHLQIVGIFSQNGLQTIKPEAKAQFSLASNPGHIYDTTVEDIVGGIGEGQLAISGTLARITSLPVAAEYPVKLRRPKDLDPSLLRPGVSGTAIIYAPHSAPFDFFGWVLFVGRSLALFL